MASLDEERRSSAAESDTQDLSFEGSLRKPGQEPIPGYRLIEPLGSGGFGEVWKCEAPGGLFKAIKFVYGNLNAPDRTASAPSRKRTPWNASSDPPSLHPLHGTHRNRRRRADHRHGAGRPQPARQLLERQVPGLSAFRATSCWATCATPPRPSTTSTSSTTCSTSTSSRTTCSSSATASRWPTSAWSTTWTAPAISACRGPSRRCTPPRNLRRQDQPAQRPVQPGHRLSAAAHRRPAVLRRPSRTSCVCST